MKDRICNRAGKECPDKCQHKHQHEWNADCDFDNECAAMEYFNVKCVTKGEKDFKDTEFITMPLMIEVPKTDCKFCTWLELYTGDHADEHNCSLFDMAVITNYMPCERCKTWRKNNESKA